MTGNISSFRLMVGVLLICGSSANASENPEYLRELDPDGVLSQSELLPLMDNSSIGKLQYQTFTYYRSDEIQTAGEAAGIVNQIVQSKCFESEVLGAQLTETRGLSNEEILLKIKNAQLKIDLEMYFSRWSRVIGYTYLFDHTIHTNRKYYDPATAAEVASNLLHETTHVLGFTHENYWATSVPYQMNRILVACIREI